jgi:hypothetical protein
LAKNKRRLRDLAAEPKQPTVESAPPVLFGIKLEVIGAEEVTLAGLPAEAMQQIRNWFSGLGAPVMEVPVGDSLLVLDRSKVAYLVVSKQEEVGNDEGGSK